MSKLNVKDSLLETLENSGEGYISGEDISERLGVTRAAVWKAVRSLREDGYVIDAVTNKGYRLLPADDMLSVPGIKKRLSACADAYIDVRKCVDSTNSQLLEMARAGARHGTALVSGEQTAGKGRIGRSFFSPGDTGLYLSVLLRPELDASDAVLVTTAAAVAVCEAIESVSELRPVIKWVNDIYLGGKKVCGILTEASFSIESGGIDALVMGAGINVYPPKDGFPEDLGEKAGFLFPSMRGGLRNELAAEIVERFMGYSAALAERKFLDGYRSRSMVVGREITVVSRTERRPATALAIDDDCHLIVRYADGGESALSSGEISILPGK